MLLGRAAEVRALGQAYQRAAAGRGGTVVLTGAAGHGFTALLRETALRATAADPAVLVLRARAAEEEAGLEHALLQQLVGPLLDALDALGPAGAAAVGEAERAALAAVAGLRAVQPGQVPLPMALLRAVEAVAAHRPVLVCVDDAAWSDPESAAALRFLGRRLARAAVCLVVAAPGPDADRDWPDADAVLPLGPLTGDDAQRWLAEQLPDLDDSAREQLQEWSQGRPRRLADLALLSRTSPGDDLSVLAVRTATVDRLRRSLDAEGPAARRARLARAVVGDGAVLEHLAEVLQRLDPGDGHEGQLPADALLDRVALELAGPEEVRRARTAWAEVLEPLAGAGAGEDATRAGGEAARQRALAATDRDADLASRLRDLARRMRPVEPRRSAELFELAAQSGDDDGLRSADRSRAAEQWWTSGHAQRAAALAAAASGATSDEARGAAERLRALDELAAGRTDRAAAHLRTALAHLAGPAPEEALPTAAALVLLTGRTAGGLALPAGVLDALPEAARDGVLLLADLCLPWDRATPSDQRRSFEHLLRVLATTDLPVYRWASDVGLLLGTTRLVDAVACERLRGDGVTGPQAVDLHLARHACALELTGLAEAAAHVEAAAAALVQAPAYAPAVAQAQALLECLRSEEVVPAEALDAAAPPSPSTESAGALWSAAHRHRLRGRMDAAAAVLGQLWPPPDAEAHQQPGAGALLTALPRVFALHESASDAEELHRSLEHVSAWARGSDAPLARTTDLLCRAVVADPADREDLVVRAAGAAGTDLTAGPAHLALGMLLRRTRRGVAAREPLDRAVRTYRAAGYAAFAGLAQRELDATAPLRPSRPLGSATLTSQERVIAALAARGVSNAEIAASLGISSRTVAHHLQSVYAKLRVTGRQQLTGRV